MSCQCLSSQLEPSEILWVKLKPNAIIPTKEDNNAGFDIYPCFEQDYLVIKAGETGMIPTGIATALPKNYYFQLEERGSTGTKGIKRSAGVIDASYRGEWFVSIYNASKSILIITDLTYDEFPKELLATIVDVYTPAPFLFYPKSKAIVQAILHEVPDLDSKEITYEELLYIPSNRGTGKLGSSGK